MEQVNVYQILIDLGYKLKDFGKEYRARPLYRDSDNDTVLKIYKDTGHWFDFKENISGDFASLVSMTLKLESPEKGQEWLRNKNFIKPATEYSKPILKEIKKFDIQELESLKKDHSYWLNRGINLDAISKFEGGIISLGKMKNRYVFPIFDSLQNVVGFSGRDITGKSKIKWKHLGDKNNFLYPIFINNNIITDKKEIILVESIGDMLNLWQNNIKNVIVTFGLNISLSILNYMLRVSPDKIIIAFNNDIEKNKAGNIAAEKAVAKLLRYFDKNQISINLPIKKDFGEMSAEEIASWRNGI
jgi:hypothetical protein